MKIAVTSEDFRTVSGHAGHARRFLVYDVTPARLPVERARLDLPAGRSFHETGGVGPHPIDEVDVLISAGFSARLVEIMAARGVVAATTTEEDAVTAVRDYLRRSATGTLLPVVGCRCEGGCHGEDHGERRAGT